MAKNNDTGLFQLENGNWAYRIVINRKTLKVDTTCRQDEQCKPFTSKKLAKEARELALVELKNRKPPVMLEVTLAEVYSHYLKNGTIGKASSTLKKQQSMWDNHVNKRFGNRFISEITLADLQNYLAELYTYGDGYAGISYSYKYTESFLKFFYLLFGRAYSEDLITSERYTKMFMDRKIRLTMPPMRQEDAEDLENIKVFNLYEIMLMDNFLQKGNGYIPFMIGYYCGLRISEVFALTWDDVDFSNSTLTIRKQMLYEYDCFCLCPVKTLNSARTVDFSRALWDILYDERLAQESRKQALGYGYRDTEIVIDKTKRQHKPITGGNFICRKENGELLTTNSMKYWAVQIKEKLGIDFKFHSLRRTHATMMANLNTPAIELMQRLGHKKFETTLQFYVNSNQLAKDTLKTNLAQLGYENAEKPPVHIKGTVPCDPRDVFPPSYEEMLKDWESA